MGAICRAANQIGCIRNEVLRYTGSMERICSHCHAVLDTQTQADWCPACGGALIERPELPKGAERAPEVDHRGIVLPRRHPVGGIITPQ